MTLLWLPMSAALVCVWTSSPVFAGPLRFKPVAPCRVVDTRNSPDAPSLARNTTRDFDVRSSVCGELTGAAAFSLNVTVVPKEPLGYVRVWAAGDPQPPGSTLNSPDGSIVSNAVIVSAGVQGRISVFTTGTTDVILDLNGYFVAATDSSALAFYSIPPCRAVDTRGYGFTGVFGPPAILSGASSRNFPLRASGCGIPSGVSAYLLNITAIPSGDLGFLTIWAGDRPRPFVSTMNAPAGRILANAAIVPAGVDGSVSVFTLTPPSFPSDVVIDIAGYFAAPFGANPLSFYPISPVRTTFAYSDPLPGGASERQLDAYAYPPSQYPVNAAHYVANVTVVCSGPLGYLQVYAAGANRPAVSTLNSLDGRTTANLAFIPLSAERKYNVFTLTEPHSPVRVLVDGIGFMAP